MLIKFKNNYKELIKSKVVKHFTFKFEKKLTSLPEIY